MAFKLSRAFYDRPTLDVARDLIGKVLVHNRRGVRTSGVIVEAEAYIGESDPACHAAPGPTERNAPMYGRPGHSYVYFNYGVHYLVNIVTEAAGSPAAVLIRALEPLDGIDVMRARRARASRTRGAGATRAPNDENLCRGPGNLTVSMGITLSENRVDLTGDRLFIENRRTGVGAVAWGPRIGLNVGTEHPWRVHVVGNPSVSGTRMPQRQRAEWPRRISTSRSHREATKVP